MTKNIYLTFSLPYRSRRNAQRFAVEIPSLDVANKTWFSNLGTRISVNKSGRFSKNTIVINRNGDWVSNTPITNKEVENFVKAVSAGVQLSNLWSK